eukprot:gnl/MRDRNA2_/MRDRNA2_141606_c0_seq1.p1 gnl/MRDRNA2_/MRDRNA2_141606_c0~~gnl/MRDRNA2_/MRDRNA2_141606_c0_seq1.p1  ORF type:complete len:213 (+),score=38.97 gnl/MRDRNA2_/MRDRNA2_141606_c0_seq1:59-640(+)
MARYLELALCGVFAFASLSLHGCEGGPFGEKPKCDCGEYNESRGGIINENTVMVCREPSKVTGGLSVCSNKIYPKTDDTVTHPPDYDVWSQGSCAETEVWCEQTAAATMVTTTCPPEAVNCAGGSPPGLGDVAPTAFIARAFPEFSATLANLSMVLVAIGLTVTVVGVVLLHRRRQAFFDDTLMQDIDAEELE